MNFTARKKSILVNVIAVDKNGNFSDAGKFLENK
jgi:hypothetical protein